MSLFIALEGIDGSGKTQLGNWLSEKTGFPICLTEEPYMDCPSGAQLRTALKEKDVDQQELLGYFLKNRRDHQRFIEEKLKKNLNVLSIRYDLSTYAYQSLNKQPSELNDFFQMIYDLHHYHQKDGDVLHSSPMQTVQDKNDSDGHMRNTRVPHLTIFVHVSAKEAMRRLDKMSDVEKEYFEKENMLDKIANNYQRAISFLEEKDGRKIAIVDGNRPFEDVFSQLSKTMKDVFHGRKE